MACSGAGWLFSCGAVQRVRVLHGWQGAKELRPALPYPQVQWLRRTCLAARTLAVALTLTLVAVVFLGAFLALALVVACLAFNEVGGLERAWLLGLLLGDEASRCGASAFGNTGYGSRLRHRAGGRVLVRAGCRTAEGCEKRLTRQLICTLHFYTKPIGYEYSRRPPQGLSERQGRTRGYSYERDYLLLP